MREFVEITKAAGKVIEGVLLCEHNDKEALVFTFTDQTYSCVSHWFDDSGIHTEDFQALDIPVNEAVRLGIASADEWNQSLDADEKRRQEEIEQCEWRQYRSLKAKFEGGK